MCRRSWGERFPWRKGSGARVAVVSYEIWQRRFASSPDIVGKTLEIDQSAYEVIGVMPSTFAFPEKDAEVWLRIANDPRWPQFQTIRIAE
jgi:MacB-like periplasmic core domain